MRIKVQIYPSIPNEVSLSYTRPCLKKKKMLLHVDIMSPPLFGLRLVSDPLCVAEDDLEFLVHPASFSLAGTTSG